VTERMTAVQRWGLPALLLLALLSRGPRLVAAGANNVASLALLPEWDRVQREVGLARCAAWIASPAAGPSLALAWHWDPDSQRVALNRGRAAWLQGNCAEARASWSQASLAAPGDEVAGLWLLVSSGASDLPLHLTPQATARYAWMAGRRTAAIDPAAAAVLYDLSLLLSPGREAAEGLAGLWVAEGRNAEAAQVWQLLAKALPPEDAGHWQALGEGAGLAGEWQRAAEAYGRGAALSAAPYELWWRQANAFRHLGLSREEERAYHRAVIACPNCLSPYMALGHLWRRQGQHAGALAWYAEAARIAPEDASSRYYRAQLLYATGEPSQAVASLEEAISLNHNKPWRWVVQAGDWRLEGGDREGALAAYRQALVWQPAEQAIEARIQRMTEGQQ
jgi:tetratricopeptide repeat protein